MGNRVFLEFSHFDLEHTWVRENSPNNCVFDFVAIEERDSSGEVIQSNKYCRDMPKPVNSSHTVVIK